MNRILTSVAALCLCATLFAQNQYQNPVIPGFYPDPSVCRVGEDYYLVNSSFHYFPGVPLWHSKDLVNWVQIGNVLDRPSQLPLDKATHSGGINAPTIRYNNGTFYVVTTNTTNGGNFFVYTKDLAGGWSDPVVLEQGGTNPSFYFEGEKCYMCSNPDGAIAICEIDPATGKTLKAGQAVWKGTGGKNPEAPHIYKKDGYYYLMISEGGTEYGHSVTIARSANIYGPYEANPANPILTHANALGQNNPIQCTGHGDLVQAADGSWWMVCLGARPQSGNHHLLGRETFLAPVSWDAGEWPSVGYKGTIELQMYENLPAWAPVDKPSGHIDFKTQHAFGPEWIYVRNPKTENYKFEKKCFTLVGDKGGLDAVKVSPTFVGRRQTDIAFVAEAKLKPNVKTEDDEVGITVFLDANKHFDIYISKRGKDDAVTVRYKLDHMTHIENQMKMKGKTVTLRIEGTPDLYTFSFTTDDKEYYILGQMETKYLSEETQGGYTGCVIGMFATSEKKGQGKFEFFDYKAK